MNNEISYTSKKNISENSLSETIKMQNGLIYSVVYENENFLDSNILEYHHRIHPNSICCIERIDKEMENYLAKISHIYRSHIVDKNLENIIKYIHELKNDKLIIKDSIISDKSTLSDIQKYTYNIDGDMTYLFDYTNDGNISYIINFLDSDDDLMDFDNPLERIDWSQITFIENPKEYYSSGLI